MGELFWLLIVYSIVSFVLNKMATMQPEEFMTLMNDVLYDANAAISKIKNMIEVLENEIDEFENQNNLYTVLVKGLHCGQQVNKQKIISCISRVVSAVNNWRQVLAFAENPSIDILISNSTEAGLVYKAEIFSETDTPSTFPAKLTRYLYERYTRLGSFDAPGMVILPTELISDNGKVLLSYVERHAVNNNLPDQFIEWLRSKNHFCNTLVDRIVPGKSESQDLININGISYTDHLHTAAEPYALWAIEGNEVVKQKLNFCL